MTEATKTKRFQAALEAAQDAMADALGACSLGEQLHALKHAELCLVEAKLCGDFPYFYAWRRKSDGTMQYTFDGPSTYLQVQEALAYVRKCFWDAAEGLYRTAPADLG